MSAIQLEAQSKFHQAELDIGERIKAIQLEATQSTSSLQVEKTVLAGEKTVLQGEITTLKEKLSAAEAEARVANKALAQAAQAAAEGAHAVADTAQSAIQGMVQGQQSQTQISMAQIQATGEENHRMHDTSRSLMQSNALGQAIYERQASQERTAIFQGIMQAAQGNGMAEFNNLLNTAFSDQGRPFEQRLLTAIEEYPSNMSNQDKVSQTIARLKQVLQFYGHFWDDWRNFADSRVAAPSSLVDIADVELIAVELEFVKRRPQPHGQAMVLFPTLCILCILRMSR